MNVSREIWNIKSSMHQIIHTDPQTGNLTLRVSIETYSPFIHSDEMQIIFLICKINTTHYLTDPGGGGDNNSEMDYKDDLAGQLAQVSVNNSLIEGLIATKKITF